MTIFVIAEDGTKLMPTSNVKKVRKLLRTGRAVICNHEPFAIKLTYSTTKYTQPIEFKEDAGYQNIGVSACSAKHEYISETRVLLKDEVEHHKDCSKYRRARRNRLRYRKPRFDNRTATKQLGWLAPSIKNKMNQHLRILDIYSSVMPITSVIIIAWVAPIVNQRNRILDTIEHLGRSVENIDTRTCVGRSHKVVARVVVADNILQISLVAHNVVSEQAGVIVGIFMIPRIQARARVGIATQNPILLTGIIRVIDRIIDDILHLELALEVTLVLRSTRIAVCSCHTKAICLWPHMQRDNMNLLAISGDGEMACTVRYWPVRNICIGYTQHRSYRILRGYCLRVVITISSNCSIAMAISFA